MKPELSRGIANKRSLEAELKEAAGKVLAGGREGLKPLVYILINININIILKLLYFSSIHLSLLLSPLTLIPIYDGLVKQNRIEN